MTKNPIRNALAAMAYIILIVLFIHSIPKLLGIGETILVPMLMLSLFVLSAAIMGYIFLYQPLEIYLGGHKKEALQLFLKTLGSFAILTVLLFVIVAITSSTEKENAKPVTFNCNEEKAITANFTDDEVALGLSDGRPIILKRAASASGSRYTNNDESIVFWNKGKEAFLTENGTETFSDCVQK